MRTVFVLAILMLTTLGGCTTLARRDAAPELLNHSVPDGFPSSVRLITTDVDSFATRSPAFFQSIKAAAGDGPINILALSGGGFGGAYGAGVLVGLSRAHTRPRFELVTGISAGALIASFAFLGPG